jgi:hypothetical protein
MAFKMKGFNPGTGTGMGSAFHKDVTKTIPRNDGSTKTKDRRGTQTKEVTGSQPLMGDGAKEKKSSFPKNKEHETSGKSNVGSHKGMDDEKGRKVMNEKKGKYYDDFMASDAGKKQFNADIKKNMADGMSEKDAVAAAQKGFTERERKAVGTKMNRDYSWAADSNLSTLVKRRNELRDGGDTSSKEYQEVQNRINMSYGDKTRHGETSETKTKKGGRVTETVTHTPGVGTKTTKIKKNKKGETTKVKEFQTHDDYYGGEKHKIKLKGDKVDNAKYTDKGNLDHDTGETTKEKKQKQYRDTKFGQSKVGQLFVKKSRRKKK